MGENDAEPPGADDQVGFSNPTAENQKGARITIVGSRPPDGGRSMDDVPRGMQNLLLMAAQDERLREALLSNRDETLDRCGVLLSDTERKVLASVSAAHLQQMIGRMGGQIGGRRDFLRTAAASVVALLAGSLAPGCGFVGSRGISPDRVQGIRPDDPRTPAPAESGTYDSPTKGIRPDRPGSPAPKPSGPAPGENPITPSSPTPGPSESPGTPTRESPGTPTPGPSGSPGTPTPGPSGSPGTPTPPPTGTGSRPDRPKTRGIDPDRP